ncbi:MAG: hypothetical protein ACLFVD_01430 [Dehalococcoidia bacterium]
MGRVSKKTVLSILLITLLTALAVTLAIRFGSGPGISKDEAIAILVGEIIEPAAEYEGISAFMLSGPLQDGDVVTSESGEDYPIDASTWFVFIDDEPLAFFAHECRYVFIDGRTGAYEVINETWPPEINNVSMWDGQNVDGGTIIEVWPILDNPTPVGGNISDAPSGDYGDAPDGQTGLYYGVIGAFPTLYHTTNSHFGRPGGHALNVGEEMLGMNVSSEMDAIDPDDPDGVPNLVDADSDERMYIIMEDGKARLALTVTVGPDAPKTTRYVNALIDFDRSGNWSTGAFGPEWVVVNLEVDVAPGDSETILTPEFSWGSQPVSPSGVWMRVALTRERVDETLFTDVGGWDGSGQFAYGEIEDHLAFLTDSPPPPGGDGDGDGNGDGNGNGNGPPPPGPEDGPCGYDINYYVLIINCGDTAKHMGQGTPIAQAASSSVASAAQSQGYTSAGNLGPGGAGDSQTSLTNIGQAIADLAAQAKCGDHVLIYICGHGSEKSSRKPEGGISIYNSSGGKTDELLTPSALASMLGGFDACDGEECGTPGCCHVSVVIESCYAGNFNTPGLNDQENIVVSGSSTDTPAQGIYPGGGVYTAGFVGGLQDSDADTDDPPDGVDPAEAHDSADAAVQNHPRSKKGKQQSWSEGDWCDCVCPCSPDIDVEKWVWYDSLETWVDEIEVPRGQLVAFRLDIESTGTCRDIVDLEIIDFLPDCLDYAGEAILYHNEIPYDRPPDEISPVSGGLQLTWDLADMGPLAPGESIAVEYSAYAESPGPNTNEVLVSAHCSYDYANIVTDQDSATVLVQEGPAEDLLGSHLEVSNVGSLWSDPDTCDSFFDIYFEVQDLTGGDYPVTYVGLYINGWLYDSWETADVIVERHIPDIPAECGETIDIALVAMNLVSVEPVVVNTASFTTPMPSPPSAEEVLRVGFEAYVECAFNQYEECTGCEVTIYFWAEDISSEDTYPVTNVVLRLDGVPSYDSNPISEDLFEYEYEFPAGCGQTIQIEVIATNLIGLEAISAGPLTTPSQP